MELLDQPRSDDSNHAGVPPGRGDHEAAALLRRAQFRCHFNGFARNSGLQLLPLGVGLVELVGQRAGLAQILREQQPDADRGVVEPPRRVDARAKPEPHVACADLTRQLSHRFQCQHAGPSAARQLAQAEVDQHTIRPGERHHVGDGAERDQIELLAQVRLRSRGTEPALLAQPLPQREQEVKRDADRRKLAPGERAARLVRIQNRDRARQVLRGRVVIDHDHVEPEPRRRVDFSDRGHTAVGADHQPRAARRQFFQRLDVEAVPFDEPLWHVEVDAAAEPPQDRNEQRRAGHAVDVVVPVNTDLFTRGQGPLQPRDGGLDALEPEWIRQLIEPRLEKPLRRQSLPVTARPQHPSDRRRHADGSREPCTLLDRLARRPVAELPPHPRLVARPPDKQAAYRRLG